MGRTVGGQSPFQLFLLIAIFFASGLKLKVRLCATWMMGGGDTCLHACVDNDAILFRELGPDAFRTDGRNQEGAEGVQGLHLGPIGACIHIPLHLRHDHYARRAYCSPPRALACP